MSYQQQRPGYPHGQYGGPAGVSALASKASELGGKMGGVTPEIWDDVLKQMQQLVEDNEKLRETLKANNNEISSLVASKEDEVKHLHKLYWDARVSVLGFKAQIVKLNGEKDHEKQKQSDISRLEDDKAALQRNALSTSDLSRKLTEEINKLKHDLSEVERREQKLREENDYLRQSHSQPPANQGQMDLLERQLRQLEFDLSEEKRSNTQFRSEVSHLKSELREAQDMNVSLGAQIGELERAAGGASKSQTDLQRELQAQKANFQSRERELERELQEKERGFQAQKANFQSRERELERKLQEKESEFRATKNQLEGENREMKRELKTKDRKPVDKDRERELQQQLEQKESDFRARKNELEHEISQMKRDLNSKDRKLAEKERELWAKNQELQAKAQEVDDYKSRPDNPDGGGGGEGFKATGNIKRRLNDEIGRNKRLAQEVESLKGQLASAASSDELETLEREKEIAERDKERATEDMERIRKEKERLAREKDQLKQDLDESRNTEQEIVDEYEAKLSTAKDDVTHLESVNIKLENERGNLVTQLENEKERVHELTVQLSKAQSDLDQTKKQLQLARTQAEGENTEIDKMVEEMSTEITAVTEELSNKKEEIRRQKSHIMQLSKERDDAVSQAAAYAKERDTAAAEYQKKENQIIADRQKKIDDYLSDAEQWKQQFEVAREDFNSERAAREKEAKAVDALRNNRESLQKQVDDLKEKVTNQQRTIANLEDRLSKHEPVDRTPLVPIDHGPPMDRGVGPMDRGPPMDRSPGPIDRGPRPMDRGPGPMDRGPGPIDRGPRPMDRRPGPMDHGPGPNHPSSGGQRMGGESPRNYRPDDRERMGTGGKAYSSVQPPRGDYGGGGEYSRRPAEWDRRPQDDRYMPRPDEYQGSGRPPTGAATHSGHTYYGGGGGGRMDDYRGPGRQFNPGGERRAYPPPPQQPQPYVDFTPLPKPPQKEGGAGSGRRGSDLNDLNQPRGQSGGGELFMGPGRGGGGGGGGHDPRRQFPPDGGDGGNFHLPGERVDSSKPTGVCPICGVGNFATQTDLELHAAKCDKFQFMQ